LTSAAVESSVGAAACGSTGAESDATLAAAGESGALVANMANGASVVAVTATVVVGGVMAFAITRGM
nr:hypothetical protein [Streptomyces sp. DSM 41633]